MAIVDISTELAAPADAVWRAVKTPAAFRTVTRGVLTMPVLKDREDTWREGETVQGWVFLFGVVPFSRHHLHVADIDDADMTLRSQERGGPIRRWNHDIVVTPVDDSRCTYRDRIDIDAGGLTAVVVGYARWFYRIRQRRWRELAGKLAVEGPN
jgi:ligand-binding SRPBCC domain-containing protein